LNPTAQPATLKEGGKRNTNGKDPAVVAGNKKPRKEFSNKSLKMGIFHVKAGTPVAKALPDKTLLKDCAGICLDFCSQYKKCNFPHQLCKNGKHYTNWKNVPGKDKLVLYKHMDSTGLMWFDAATFEKHRIIIPPKYAHLLGNANGTQQKYVITYGTYSSFGFLKELSRDFSYSQKGKLYPFAYCLPACWMMTQKFISYKID
jgi:hypothetical protein